MKSTNKEWKQLKKDFNNIDKMGENNNIILLPSDVAYIINGLIIPYLGEKTETDISKKAAVLSEIKTIMNNGLQATSELNKIKKFLNNLGLEIYRTSIVKRKEPKSNQKVVLYSFAKTTTQQIDDENAIKEYAKWFQEERKNEDGEIEYDISAFGARNLFSYVLGNKDIEFKTINDLAKRNNIIVKGVKQLLDIDGHLYRIMTTLGLSIKIEYNRIIMMKGIEELYDITNDTFKLEVSKVRNTKTGGTELVTVEQTWAPSAELAELAELPPTSNELATLPNGAYQVTMQSTVNNVVFNKNTYILPEEGKKRTINVFATLAAAVALGFVVFYFRKPTEQAERVAVETNLTDTSTSEAEHRPETRRALMPTTLVRTTKPITYIGNEEEGTRELPRNTIGWYDEKTRTFTTSTDGSEVLKIEDMQPDEVVAEGRISTKTIEAVEIRLDDGQTMEVPENTEVTTDGSLPNNNEEIHISFSDSEGYKSGWIPYLALETSQENPDERKKTNYTDTHVDYVQLTENATFYDEKSGEPVKLPEGSICSASGDIVVEDGIEYQTITAVDPETNQILSGVVTSSDIENSNTQPYEKEIPENLENAEWEKAEANDTIAIFLDKELATTCTILKPETEIAYTFEEKGDDVAFVRVSEYEGWVSADQLGLNPEESEVTNKEENGTEAEEDSNTTASKEDTTNVEGDNSTTAPKEEKVNKDEDNTTTEQKEDTANVEEKSKTEAQKEDTANVEEDSTTKNSINKSNTNIDNDHIILLNADKLDKEKIEKIIQQNIPENIENPMVNVENEVENGDMIINWSSGKSKPNSAIIMCSTNSTNIQDIIEVIQNNNIYCQLVVNLSGDYNADSEFVEKIQDLKIKTYIELTGEKADIQKILEQYESLGIYTFVGNSINPLALLKNGKTRDIDCILEVQTKDDSYEENAQTFIEILRANGFNVEACVVQSSTNGIGWAEKPKANKKQSIADEKDAEKNTKPKTDEEEKKANNNEKADEEKKSVADKTEQQVVEKDDENQQTDKKDTEENDEKQDAEKLTTSINPNGEENNQKSNTDTNAIDLFVAKIQVENPDLKINTYNPDITFNDAVEMESKKINGQPLKLLHPNSFSSNWFTSDSNTYQGGWKEVNKTTIAYYMDPRNNSICQFLRIDVMPQNITLEDLKLVISANNYSWLYNHEEALYNMCKKKNLNVYFALARLINEQGVNGSATYKMESDGTYYYNPGNIKATGRDSTTIINNALNYAKDKGWDSLDKGIEGFLDITLNQWIKSGQNTPFLIMYNINRNSQAGGNASKQYAQAANASASAGKAIEDYYKITGKKPGGTVEIPAFGEMPTSKSKSPDEIVQENDGRN